MFKLWAAGALSAFDGVAWIVLLDSIQGSWTRHTTAELAAVHSAHWQCQALARARMQTCGGLNHLLEPTLRTSYENSFHDLLLQPSLAISSFCSFPWLPPTLLPSSSILLLTSPLFSPASRDLFESDDLVSLLPPREHLQAIAASSCKDLFSLRNPSHDLFRGSLV